MISLSSLKNNFKLILLGLSAILLLANSSAFAQDAACNQEVSDHTDKFKDVPKNHYAAEAVLKLAEQNIVKGDADGFLGATCDTTREHAAIFIYRLKFESKPDNSKTVPFTDILSLSDESKNAIQTLYSKGIVNGTSSDKFSPNDPLTRAAAATMLARAYFMETEIEAHASMAPLFDDVPSGQWYFNPIQTLAYECVVSGTGDKKFNPDEKMKRIDFIFALAHAHQIVARCSDGKTCNTKKGICSECDPNKGEKKCSGNNLQMCSADGLFVNEKACPNGCKDNACSGEETSDTCKDGEKSCDGNFAVTCNNGKPQKTDCTATNTKCVNGACQKEEAGKCTEGKTQCNAEGNHQICTDGKWKADPCPNKQVCQDGKCVEKPAADKEEKCTNGKYRCNDDGERQKCVSEKWEDDPCDKNETCTEAGKCAADASCTTGDSKCAKSVHMVCKKGKWVEDPCKSGYVCKKNVCTKEDPPEVYEDDPSCSQGNNPQLPVPLAILMMLAGAGLLIRRKRHSA